MEISGKLTEMFEIHFDIVEEIVRLLDIEDDEQSNKVMKRDYEQGRGGLYELAMVLTLEFIETYKNEVWGITKEYQDTIEEFLKEKLY